MRKTAFPLLLLAFLASACTGTSAPPPQVTVTDTAFQSLTLNARRLEIIENWQMPIEAPYIGHLQQPYPSNLVSVWASRVLVPAGIRSGKNNPVKLGQFGAGLHVEAGKRGLQAFIHRPLHIIRA